MALGHGQRRLRKLSDQIATCFTEVGSRNGALDQAARHYHEALRLAFEADLATALQLHQDYDARIPADRYPLTSSDRPWLAVVVSQPRPDVLDMGMRIAARIGLPDLQRAIRDRLAVVLCEAGDASLLIAHLRQWRESGLLDGPTLAAALDGQARRRPLDQDEKAWRSFLAELSPDILPDRFDVHCLLGHGVDAVRLCQAPAQEHMALECCLGSQRLEDALAGLDLARRLPGPAGTLVAHAQHVVALRAPEIDALAGRQEYAQAATLLREVLDRLGPAEPAAPSADAADELASCRADLIARRQVLLEAARYDFQRKVPPSPARDGDLAVHAAWSQFEETAGEHAFAARHAADAGDLYRAHYLYREAGLFGEAARVIKADDSPKGVLARAEAYEAGGDLLGAARCYEQCGQVDRAVATYMNVEDFAAAARCLVAVFGDQAIEDPRTADCLLRARDYDTLARISEAAVRARGQASKGARQLRSLVAQDLLPPQRKASVRELLELLGERERQRFEERAATWVSRARAETDRRFAGIWGMDLGTRTSVAAVYDTTTEEAVVCAWRGSPLLPSTISLDRHGNEFIGIAGDEAFSHGLIGRIVDAKRRMGKRVTFKIREHAYRPEEAAARLVQHAREQVEDFLSDHVRGRLRALAAAELTQVREEWLTWAEQNFDLRLERPRAVVTIPASFSNNQKQATRTACKIATIDLVRLIHEPSAACIEVARQRHLAGDILVVDLGAGTLDFSLFNVSDGICEAKSVGGDANFGSRDFDAAIVGALRTQLADQGITVDPSGAVRLRLEVAAEKLKIDLSSREHAQYELSGVADGANVTLELDRSQLASILSDLLGRLRAACTKFKESAGTPQRLVLVGAPMLSPMVREVVEEAFGLPATPVRDPRLAVACGAAIQAAVHDGRCRSLLLMDITPLSLGIRTKRGYAEQIAAHAIIPVKKSHICTTTRDNQSEVRIEIFNGSLDGAAKVGDFFLTGIQARPAGTPQFEVTFGIDASCVLEVTARDLGTGRPVSMWIGDTTMLPPAVVTNVAWRFLEQRQRGEARRAEQAKLKLISPRVARLAALSGDCETAWRELRQRKAAFRPGRGPLDAATQVALGDLSSRERQVEADVQALLAVLGDLRRDERALQATTGGDAGVGRDDDGLGPTDADVLAERLGIQLSLASGLLATLEAWNGALIAASAASASPLGLFRGRHEAGNYRAALDSLPGPVEDIADVRRQLHCLAEVGDAEGYRGVLAAHGGRLGALPVMPSAAEEFAALAQRGLVRVRVIGPDGNQVTGAGFLAAESVVVTGGQLAAVAASFGDPGARVAAVRVETLAGGPVASLAEVRAAGNVAVLRLSGRGEGMILRLGFSVLARVGDVTYAVASADPGDQPALGSGVVERFLRFPDSGISVFKVTMDLPESLVGGPLFNELGEVIAVITSAQRQDAVAAFAVTVDSMSDLLTEVGVERSLLRRLL